MNNSSTICVDAGLVVRRVVIPQDAAIQAIWEQWATSQTYLIAPTLLRYEVTNAVYQYQKTGALSAVAAHQALRAAFALPLSFVDDADLSSEALSIAGRFSLPAAYDAHYLALAERLGATFVTTDQRLANAVQSALPWVHVAGT